MAELLLQHCKNRGFSSWKTEVTRCTPDYVLSLRLPVRDELDRIKTEDSSGQFHRVRFSKP